MNNIDRIKDYIQDAFISPLERLMNGDNGEKEVSLYEKYRSDVTVLSPVTFEVAKCDIKLGRNKKTSICFYTRRHRNAE